MSLFSDAFANLAGLVAQGGAAQAQMQFQAHSQQALLAQQYAQMQQNLSPYLQLGGFGLSNMPSATPPVIRRGKCDGCGSREFKEHRGQTVCSYCRSSA